VGVGRIGGFNTAANAYQHTSNAHRLLGTANRSLGTPGSQNPTQTAIPGILPLQIGNMSAALVFQSTDGDSVELSHRAMGMQGFTGGAHGVLEPQGACETCANRRYVDVSDDMSVSFQTPTNIHPSIAAVKVSSHEQEHVRNEQANAERNDRTITHQSVTFQYAICPECGRFYVAGGTTRTQSVGNTEEEDHTVGPDLGSGVGDHEHHHHHHGDDEDGHSH